MQMALHARRLIGLLLAQALALGALGGCSGRCRVVVLNIEGAPADTARLAVRLTLDGVPAREVHEYRENLRRIAVQVPEEARGSLGVTVTALGESGCELGNGADVLPLPEDECIRERTVGISGQARRVTVRPSGVPGGVRALRVSHAGAGLARAQVLELRPPVQEFSLLLPRPADGLVTVYAEGVSEAECVAARAEARVTLDACQPAETVALPFRDLGPAGQLCACTAEVCWESPTVPRHTLHAVFPVGGAVWAVGARGTILRRRQGAAGFEPVQSGTTQDLYGIWGTSERDLWVVGNDVVLHDAGQGFVPERARSAGTWYGVGGNGGGDVWISGMVEEVNTGFRSASLLHGVQKGSAWEWQDEGATLPKSVLQEKSLYSVWVIPGSGPGPGSVVWAAGGTYARAGYYPAQSGVARRLVLNRVNGTWKEVVINVAGAGDWPLRQITGVEDEIWAVGGFYNDPGGGTPQSSVLRLAGGAWQSLSAQAGNAPLNAVWGASKGDVWLAGGDLSDGASKVLRWNGAALRAVPLPAGNNALLRGIAGAAGEVHAVGDGGTHLRIDQTTEAPVGAPVPLQHIVGLWAAAADDVWAVGAQPMPGGADHGIIRRWDGARWQDVTPTPPPPPLFSVWGSGPRDVWIGGDKGTVLHHDGALTRDAAAAGVAGAQRGILALWGSGADDLWAAGGTLGPGLGPVLMRRRGGTWESQIKRLEADAGHGCAACIFYALWGAGADDLWAGGGENGKPGVLFHLQGGAWRKEIVPGEEWVLGIWGSGTNNAAAVAGSVQQPSTWIAFYKGQGKVWERATGSDLVTKEAIIRADRFKSLWGSGAGDVWAVGGNIVNNRLQAGEATGHARHFNGAAWRRIELPASVNLDAVAGAGPHNVWMGGHGGAILRRRLPAPATSSPGHVVD